MKRLMRLKEVTSLTGLSRSSIYNYIANGAFPPQVKIGYRSVAWRETDVYDWIESRTSF